MKITKDLFINKLIEFYSNISAHKDYHKLNKVQLKLLNKILGINDLITIDYSKKIIIMKPLNTLNRACFEGYKDKYEYLSEYQIKNIVEYSNYYINDIFNRIININRIGQGEMCTNDLNELIKRSINLNIRNRVIASHEEQILKEYKGMLSDIIDLFYYTENLKNSENVINLNIVVTKAQEKIINKNLNDIDYF